MTWLSDNPWLAWVGVMLVMLAIEAASVDFVFVMFAGGALAGAIVAGAGVGFPVQVVVAVVVALGLLLLVRPLLKRTFTAGVFDHGIGAPGLVGRPAVVVSPVSEHDGRVKLAGDIWSARASGVTEFPVGADVIVIAIDGATAIVAPQPSHV